MKTEDAYKLIQEDAPVLRYCERFTEGSEKWDMTRHSHPYIELIFYLEGRTSVEVDGYHVEPSIYDMLVYPANCMHLDGVKANAGGELSACGSICRSWCWSGPCCCVTRDIPANSFAAGVPAKVIRPITEKDSIRYLFDEIH